MIAIISALRGELERSAETHERILYSRCGVGTARAIAHTQAIVASQKITAIYFVGSAGALHPQLPTGTIAVPQRVIRAAPPPPPLEHNTAETTIRIPDTINEQQLTEIAKHTPLITCRPLLTVDTAVATREERAALYRRYGADTVDMEAWGVGWVARQACIPLLIIKFVTDRTPQELRYFRVQLKQCAAMLKIVLSVVLETKL